LVSQFDTLVGALDVEDRFIQAEAARLLGELRRKEAVGPLLRYVGRFGWQTKLVGFHALAQIGDRGVCPALRPLVDKPNCFNDWYWYGCRGVRAAAAIALLALGDDAGAACLRELADAGHDVFYAWFAPAILRLGDEPPATSEIKARITLEAIWPPDKPLVRRTDGGVVTMVAETLGLLGTERAFSELVGLMRFRSRYVRGQAALSLLSAAPTKKHLAAVEKIARSDKTDFARIKAHEALARCSTGVSPVLPEKTRKASVDAIAALAAKAADPFDQAVAVESLGSLACAEHSPLIRQKLSHADPYVRRCAIEALERIEPAAGGEAAAASLDDPDPFVRLQAAKSFVACE